MDAATPLPLHKRARELDETEQPRDAKQRRVEPDAHAQSRAAAQPVEDNPTTTGATAHTQLHSTSAAASRAARVPSNGTQALCPPAIGPVPVGDVEMHSPPSRPTSSRPVAGRPQIERRRVILIVRPPATKPISPFEEPRAAQPARQSASSSKRPLAAVANDSDFDAQTVALQRIADDRSASGEAFVLKAPPASARRPKARAADEDWCYCTICLRAMAVAAIAAEAMAAAAAASRSPPPPPSPPPMFQLGGQASGLFPRVDDGEETTTEIGSENEESIDVEYDAFFL